ncbi:MAG: restriction endonuclease subunit S [Clostridium sp.]|nr:restriction endonuclease subunit S [Clostridium sp.]
MRTCKVSKLFYVKYGVNLELNSLIQDSNGINFVSRTSKNNGVSAKVKPISYIEPLPAGTITVAGGGSVMETFLQMSPYYSGRDLYYLTAKVPMTNEQKLFYCLCLRENKYKFSYGRQSNVTLPDLLIPTLDSIPEYVNYFSLEEYGKNLLLQVDFPESSSRYEQTGKNVPLEKIFNVAGGISSSQVMRSRVKENINWIPYIRPSYRQETSIDAYVNKNAVPREKIFPSKTLYVSTDGQGSHTFSYVSTFEFVPNSNVSVLLPKRKMELQEKLFYAQCITNNRYKFSYGRKPKGKRLKSIMLPEYPPNYVLDYNINSVVQSFNSVLEKV